VRTVGAEKRAIFPLLLVTACNTRTFPTWPFWGTWATGNGRGGWRGAARSAVRVGRLTLSVYPSSLHETMTEDAGSYVRVTPDWIWRGWSEKA